MMDCVEQMLENLLHVVWFEFFLILTAVTLLILTSSERSQSVSARWMALLEYV
jgi:hypothetical protein